MLQLRAADNSRDVTLGKGGASSNDVEVDVDDGGGEGDLRGGDLVSLEVGLSRLHLGVGDRGTALPLAIVRSEHKGRRTRETSLTR